MLSSDAKCIITFHGPDNESMFVLAYRDTGAAFNFFV